MAHERAMLTGAMCVLTAFGAMAAAADEPWNPSPETAPADSLRAKAGASGPAAPAPLERAAATQEGRAASSPGARDETSMITVTPGALLDAACIVGPAADYWKAHVAEPDRVRAVQAAHQDALRLLVEQVARLEVVDGLTVGDAMAGRTVATRPVVSQPRAIVAATPAAILQAARATGIRYRPDAPAVDVRVEMGRRAAYATLRSWARVHRPDDQELLDALEQRIVRDSGWPLRAVGTGRANRASRPSPQPSTTPASGPATATTAAAPAAEGRR